ncbi:MAG TPA: glycine zipper 2TM domain-containing protein [Rhodocyclaceae bacterium]|nr:glycine zipper 2TM domain-containing protein [Rhodocyclaceae bacterium]
MESTGKKLHPLIMVAAISVTAASLAAIGVLTGIIPGSKAEAPAPVVAQAAAPIAPVTPAAAPEPVSAVPPPAETPKSEPVPPKPAVKHVQSAPARKPAPAGSGYREPPPVPADYHPETASASSAPVAPPVCHECGTVESVRQLVQQGQGTGLGAVAGGVLGGVLGHQVGSGRGNDLATVVGAVGGAVAGHQVEKSQRKTVHYEITVRMDDGAIQTINAESQPSWHGGERVKVINGVVQPMI